ncbi:RICIN domain-containing protein [Kitasatospora sp. NPDC096147]|uniref:RICIN domain-containing protein n=1 Tax=Kitasatospora sp. NPDC096147 TaxID=3364093 RepID=UPI0038267375
MKSLKALGVVATAIATVAFGSGTANAVGVESRIVNAYSGLCVIVSLPSGNGAPVKQFPCDSINTSQVWQFIPTRDNDGRRAFFLKNTGTNKCMGMGSKLRDGAKVIQWDCNGEVDEKFWVYSSGVIRSVYSGKCLGVGSSMAWEKQLIQWPCNSNSTDQFWGYADPYDTPITDLPALPE